MFLFFLILYLPFTLFSLDVCYFPWTYLAIFKSCHSSESTWINSAQFQHKSCTSVSLYFFLDVSISPRHTGMLLFNVEPLVRINLIWVPFWVIRTNTQTFNMKVILLIKWLGWRKTSSLKLLYCCHHLPEVQNTNQQCVLSRDFKDGG